MNIGAGSGGNKPVVVLIWMTGVDLALLQRRLRACGFDCRRFAYLSIHRSPAQNAERLHRFLRRLDAEVVHLVAHSLGGIVLLHLFDRYPDQAPGRVVMLGTPAGGSAVARRLHASAWTRWLVGRSVERGLLGDAPAWTGRAELGVIAGNLSLGVGRLVTRASNDTERVIDARSLKSIETLKPVTGKTSGHRDFNRNGSLALLSIWDQDRKSSCMTTSRWTPSNACR